MDKQKGKLKKIYIFVVFLFRHGEKFESYCKNKYKQKTYLEKIINL